MGNYIYFKSTFLMATAPQKSILIKIAQRKTTFCNKFKLLALVTICANVSNSESSTSHFNICPILVNLGRESKSLRAEMSVKDEFLTWKISSLPIEFLHNISSRKKSLKKVALVSKCTSRSSKSGHAENRIECNQLYCSYTYSL